MTWQVRRAAVLGGGVMGGAIAAHLANAGIPSLVLDIVPRELTAAEKAAGLSLADRPVRDRLAADAVRALAKQKPAPLFSAERQALITSGNLTDDLPRLREADWVIEVVKEDLDIKLRLLAAAAPHLKPDAILSSNTSGLSLAAMARALPAPLRPRFLGTHFFNPPRYMRLLEVIPTPETDPAVLAAVSACGAERLGKGIVLAKDSPNFIANRIGVHAMLATFRVMEELGLTIEEIDALTGPALGRPKTATFRLADLVGLDTLLHVADNVRANVPRDESRAVFEPPAFLRRMVAAGLLGRKSGAGFYKRIKGGPDGEDTTLTLDLATLEYRPKQAARFPEIEAGKALNDPGERIRTLLAGRGRAAEAAWKLLAPSLSYAAMRLGEIADDADAVDRAVRWGFNWDLGPFETWDALGLSAVAARLRADGHPLPTWVDALLAAGAQSLYAERDGLRHGPALTAGAPAATLAPVWRDPRAFDFASLRRAGREVRRNPGASLLDLGDGVLGLEFHAKLNVIGQDTITMTLAACDEAERNWRALVVANQGDSFSAGANLALLLQEAIEGNWDEIDAIVRAFQRATDRLEQCAVPVVLAPHGLALGGGCEVTLAGHAIHAAAETYIGLVEFGAGVVPAGGGCLRLYQRQVALLPDPSDLYPALRRTFETIGMARVATSAEEARQIGFLRPQDGWSMDGARRIAAAKELALALAGAGHAPPPPATAVPVMGRAGVALIETVLYNLEEAGRATAHDRKIGRALARVLSGGDVPGPVMVSARHLLDLEREAFLRLCGERKTLERMQSLLKTGKPLRN